MNPKQNRLAQLIRDNASRSRDYRVVAATDATEATIYIYDVIGFDWWTGEGVTAKRFAQDLDALAPTVETVHLRINSPGGDVFEARAMIAAMHRHKARFIAHIDGLAASAASVIAVNADECEMVKGSFQMIHNAWTIAIGDRNAMLEQAELLEQVDGTIADDYERKSKRKRNQIVQWMDDETWFTADEAVDAGLADRVIEQQVKASAWNVAGYERAPKALTERPTIEQQGADARAAMERRLALLERVPA